MKRFSLSTLKQQLMSMILTKDMTDQQAARSVALGIGCAFLPFPGFQTPFLIAISVLFRLNFPFMYLVNCLVNNGFTAVPIAIAAYSLGLALLASIGLPQPELAIDFASLSWALIQQILLPFLVGSGVPLLILPLIVYGPVLILVRRIRQRSLHDAELNTEAQTNEA